MTGPVGVILAAGRAARMGSPKQLLPFGDSTVLGSVVAAANKSRLARTIVVVGANGEAVAASVADDHVEVVHNPDPDRGNLSSLHVAAAAAAGQPLLLVMGDMPGVGPEIIDAHLEAWAQEQARMRVTRYIDGVGHPFMLSPELVATLNELTGSKPLWLEIGAPGTESLRIESPMPVDIDTPEDYRAALERLEPMQHD